MLKFPAYPFSGIFMTSHHHPPWRSRFSVVTSRSSEIMPARNRALASWCPSPMSTQLVAWLVRMRTPHGPVVSPPTSQATNTALPETEQVKPQHHPPQNIMNVKRASAFTDEEKKELA